MFRGMEELKECVKDAIALDSSVCLYIESEELPDLEKIINPSANLPGKLEYWKEAYNDELEHRYAEGIRIVDWEIV